MLLWFWFMTLPVILIPKKNTKNFRLFFQFSKKPTHLWSIIKPIVAHAPSDACKVHSLQSCTRDVHTRNKKICGRQQRGLSLQNGRKSRSACGVDPFNCSRFFSLFLGVPEKSAGEEWFAVESRFLGGFIQNGNYFTWSWFLSCNFILYFNNLASHIYHLLKS